MGRGWVLGLLMLTGCLRGGFPLPSAPDARVDGPTADARADSTTLDKGTDSSQDSGVDTMADIGGDVAPLQAWAVQGLTSEPTLDANTQMGVTIGPDNSVYVTGRFVGTLNVGPEMLASASATSDIFVVKFKPDGSVVWARVFGGSADDQARDVVLTGTGELWITGRVTGFVSFDGLSLPVLGSKCFLVRLDPATGQPLEAMQLGAGASASVCVGMAAAGPNELFLVGDYGGTLSLAGQSFSAGAGNDFFLTRFNTDTGQAAWAIASESSSVVQVAAVAAASNGQVAAVGFFQGDLVVGASSKPSAGADDGFVINVDASGVPLWISTAGGSMQDRFYGVAFDKSNKLYVGGFYRDGAAFGAITPVNAGSADGVVVRYAPTNGAVVWVSPLSTPGFDEIRDLTPLTDGVDAASVFSADVAIGTSALVHQGQGDTAVLRVDGTGMMSIVAAGGGTGIDRPKVLHRAGLGLVLTGLFEGSATFGGVPLAATDGDLFIWSIPVP